MVGSLINVLVASGAAFVLFSKRVEKTMVTLLA